MTELNEIRRIAQLAKLQVEEAELPKIAAELDDILRFAAQIAQAQAEDVGSEQGIGLEGLREDTVAPSTEREALLSNAAVSDGVFYIARGEHR